MATLLEKYPDTLNLEHIKAIRDTNALLEYFIKLEQGQFRARKEFIYTASIKALACSVCKGGMPLYRRNNEWYCLEHIPRTITFPIGLHGADFEAWKGKK